MSPGKRALAFAILALSARVARAEEEPTQPPRAAARSASSGAFLPFTAGARSDGQKALVFGQGGYAQGKGAVFETVIEAQLFGRVSVRAGGSYTESAGSFKPEVAMRVDALRQESSGVDLAVLGGYEAAGFNTVRAVTARVAVSRAFGDTRLVSNLGCGFGLDEGERYGDFRLAGLRRLTPNLHLGLDSRARVNLERDASEPAGEPDLELVAGPVATYAIGRFILSASGGVSALKLRQGDTSTRVGATGTLGLGAVF